MNFRKLFKKKPQPPIREFYWLKYKNSVVMQMVENTYEIKPVLNAGKIFYKVTENSPWREDLIDIVKTKSAANKIVEVFKKKADKKKKDIKNAEQKLFDMYEKDLKEWERT